MLSRYVLACSARVLLEQVKVKVRKNLSDGQEARLI